MKERILIVDDHAVVRHGLRALLELSGMQVVGEARDGREALDIAGDLNPDVVIMDVTMPGLNGIDAIEVLRQRCPGCRSVVLSMHSDSEHVNRAFAAGASAYLLKGSAGEEIISAVQAVKAGRTYLSMELAHIDPTRAAIGDSTSPLDRLSSRERQVLQLVVEGHSSASIASVVNLSPKSVDTYRSRVMKKLGVRDLPGLIKFAIQNGLSPGN